MSILTVRDLVPEVKENGTPWSLNGGEARLILAAAVDARDEPADLVASIRQHFAGTGLELELPDRKSNLPRPIRFGS
jgi:hypothetical protein